MFVRSLGWDPGHHEEVQNSPENKIHIWEVIFRVPEKSRILRESSRRFWKVHLWGPPVMGSPMVEIPKGGRVQMDSTPSRPAPKVGGKEKSIFGLSPSLSETYQIRRESFSLRDWALPLLGWPATYIYEGRGRGRTTSALAAPPPKP